MIFIIWPFTWDFSGSIIFFSWHAIALAKISSSSFTSYDTFWDLFSKCDETTDVNLKKDSSILSAEGERLIFFIYLFGRMGEISDEESRYPWFNSDKIFLLDAFECVETGVSDLECTDSFECGETSFSFCKPVSECSNKETSLSLAFGLCNKRKSSSLWNDSKKMKRIKVCK